MTEALFLIARYQFWLYACLGLLALWYVRAFWQAWNALNQTLFGLEKENALQKLNTALAMLIILAALAVFVYMNEKVLVPNIEAEKATPLPTLLPPTSTPIPAGGGPLVVDSSGCDNPDVTLTEPKSGERIVSGGYEVKGTAVLPALAFYTLEINGAATQGAWLPVAVGNTVVQDGILGRFDTGAYAPGDYVLRLIVKDSAGNYPRPCEVLITIVGLDATPTPAPN
jgi:hypothetical protein